MFCPDCKAEYRPGFTRCSDCDVNLVEQLDETDTGSSDSELSDTPELLWTGTDAQERDGIIEALEAAKIPYHQRSDKVGALPGWSRQVCAIFTHARDHRAACATLEDVARLREMGPPQTDDEPDSSSSFAQDPPQTDDEDELSELPPDYVPEDFDPDDATVEVWSGQDATTRENLITCLRGIGIGSVTEDSAGQLRIRVTPSSQKRAKETIRQIMDASEAQ